MPLVEMGGSYLQPIPQLLDGANGEAAVAPSEIAAPPCVGAQGSAPESITRASVADRAGLRCGDEAIDVLLEQEAAVGERLGRSADLIDVALVRRIALLDRRP